MKMKQVKVEWCKNWLVKTFERLPSGVTGIERNCLFSMAEKAGLYEHDTYGTPLSEALCSLTKVKAVNGSDGEFAYHAFELK